jgi:hypothetical protein
MSEKKPISKTQKIISTSFLGLWAIPVLWALLYGGNLWLERFQLSRFGEVIQGVVLNTDVFHGRYDRYYITYEFLPHGGGDTKLTNEKEVTGVLFENYLVGDSIPIRYLPASPKASNIEGNDPLQLQGLRLIMMLSPAGLVLGLVILVVFLFRHLEWF